jgi:hypothetical protein
VNRYAAGPARSVGVAPPLGWLSAANSAELWMDTAWLFQYSGVEIGQDRQPGVCFCTSRTQILYLRGGLIGLTVSGAMHTDSRWRGHYESSRHRRDVAQACVEDW